MIYNLQNKKRIYKYVKSDLPPVCPPVFPGSPGMVVSVGVEGDSVVGA